MTFTTRNFLFQLLAMFLLIPLLVKSASVGTGENFLTPDNYVYVIAVLSVALLIVMAATVLFMCGDCYNSEVSSSTHAACGGNKWGGGEGYNVASSQNVNVSVMQSSHTFGEVANPSGNQTLPYSMIPSHIQTEQEFVGYESTTHTNLTGYSDGGVPQVNRNVNEGSQRGVVSHGAGSVGGGEAQMAAGSARRHVNPMEETPEEPPPSYNEAIGTGR